jgi:hypothetical protein
MMLFQTGFHKRAHPERHLELLGREVTSRRREVTSRTHKKHCSNKPAAPTNPAVAEIILRIPGPWRSASKRPGGNHTWLCRSVDRRFSIAHRGLAQGTCPGHSRAVDSRPGNLPRAAPSRFGKPALTPLGWPVSRCEKVACTIRKAVQRVRAKTATLSCGMSLELQCHHHHGMVAATAWYKVLTVRSPSVYNSQHAHRLG